MHVFAYAAAIISVSVAYAWLGVYLARRFMEVSEGHNDVPVPIFQTAGTIYAVLLAFSVIAVWQSYGDAKANVAEEASTLTTLYRQTNGLPNPEQGLLRHELRAYTSAVIVDEWPIQAATGGAAASARRAIGDIYRSYSTMDPRVAASPIGVDFLATMRTVAADRNRRTLQASEALPAVLWIGLLVGGFIVIGMTFALHTEAAWPHYLFAMLIAALIGTLLFITLVLHRPFSGPLAIQPDSFQHSLDVFDAVDRGD
jgi:hypothetical protein